MSRPRSSRSRSRRLRAASWSGHRLIRLRRTPSASCWREGTCCRGRGGRRGRWGHRLKFRIMRGCVGCWARRRLFEVVVISCWETFMVYHGTLPETKPIIKAAHPWTRPARIWSGSFAYLQFSNSLRSFTLFLKIQQVLPWYVGLFNEVLTKGFCFNMGSVYILFVS